MRKLTNKLICLAVLALAVVPAIAAADPPIQEFNVQVKDVRPATKTADARYTVDVSTRTTDPLGGKADPVTKAIFRFPSGVKIKGEFMTKRFLCDLKLLKLSKNPDKCKQAIIGRGTALVDARPLIPEALNANVTLFLGAPSAAGALASFYILGEPISSDQIIRNAKQVFVAPIYHDPTPDGKYGYRLELDTNIETPIPGLEDISVTEVKTSVPGLTYKKKPKGKKKAKAKKKVKTLFWITPPACPPSREINFLTTFEYKTSPTLDKEVGVPCAKYQ